ncbi:hypothetical protein BH24CHL9_BH24CHL9_14720 [soil metagenome]
MKPNERSVSDLVSTASGPPPAGPGYGGYYGSGQPGDRWSGPPPSDPYLAGGQPGDPWYGRPGDPYAPGGPYAPPQDPYAQQGWYGPPPGSPQWPVPPPRPERRSGSGAAVVGIFLVLIGLWFLFREQIGLDLGTWWPAAAVVLGVIMVIAAFIPRRAR